MRAVGGVPSLSYRSMISYAHATASLARMPDGCGDDRNSRFSGRSSDRTPLRRYTVSPSNRYPPRSSSSR